MAQTKSLEIRCEHCKEWFNSPVFFAGTESFDDSDVSENLVQCPKCRKITGCNKENMRLRAPDGGFLGSET